jgi:Tfp pilus assembly protein PilF
MQALAEGAMRLISFKLKTWVVAGTILVSQAAIAQRGSTGSSHAPSRTAPPPVNNPNTTTNTPQPIFVSGKVLLEGGGTLPEPVAIERVCSGINRREGYTDLKGQYQFQLGQNSTFQDASESDRPTVTSIPQPGTSNSRRPPDLTGCELRAVLVGFQSSAVILRNAGSDTWQYEVAPIYLKRLGNAPGNTISVTSMAAPKNAMHAYEKAQKVIAENPVEAEKQLEKAVHEYPRFAAAWNLLGNMHRERNKFDSARTEYEKAIAADPQYVNPLYGLTIIAMQEKKWDEATHLSDQVLKLNAGAFPLAYFFNAAANYNLQKNEAAEDSAKKFKALDTHHEHPDVCLLLSYIYSNKQDFAGAAREIRDYLAASPNSPNADSLRTEAKRLEDLSISAKSR